MVINVSEADARGLVELYDDRRRIVEALKHLRGPKCPAFFTIAFSGFGFVDKMHLPKAIPIQTFSEHLAEVDRYIRQAGGIVPT